MCVHEKYIFVPLVFYEEKKLGFMIIIFFSMAGSYLLYIPMNLNTCPA